MNNIYKKIMALSLVSITVIGCIPSKVTDSETSSSNSFTYSDFESFYNDNESLFISDSTISDDLSFIESDYLSSNQDSFTNNSNDVDSSVFSDNVSDSTISDSSINNSSEDNKRYTVTFTFKDEIVDTIEVECNDILTNLPTLEQKNGYENVVWDYDNTPITSDITIEAKYDLIQYNIYYNIEYGENNTLNVLTYNIESDDITLYAPVNIEEIGKSFVGWFTSSDFKNDSFVNSIKTGSYGDITLYAKFDTCVVEEVKGFTIDYSTSDHPSIKGEVDDTCDSISFLDIVKVSNNCKFKIYSDEDCTNEIDDKTISLSSGHNYFYLVVSCGNDISLKYIIDVNKKEKETIIGDENEFEYQGVKYKLDNDVYKVVGYTDNIESEVTIVSQYNDKMVTCIDESAFSNCNSLTSITIPSSVTSIGSYAFYGCDSLQYNEYDNGLYLGNNENPYLVLVKTKDTSITSCIINENARFIYSYAFYNCSSLTTVIFEENSQLESIGEWAFAGCYSLQFNEYDNGLYLGNNENPYLVLVKTKDTSITSCIINENARFIYSYAFYDCSSLTTVIFEENSQLESIGNNAFYDCSSLTSITIPSSVTTIGEWAFEYCSSLTTVIFEENSQLESIGNNAFYDCSSLTSITIPSSVTTIGEWAFKYCSSLTTVIFEENSQLESIGNNAFYNCSKLTSIKIPSSVTTIGELAFEYCSSLTNVYYSGTIEDWCRIIFDGWGSNPMIYALHFYMLDENNNYKEVTSIEIPSTITSIGDYQFYGFNNVTSITIPSSVTTIGEWAFYYCSSLTSITLPSSVTSIGSYAFYNCSSLTTVIFEENSQLESIGNNAFYNCSKLTSIKIPSSVTTIGSYAFLKCSSLTSITLPSSVTSIGEWAFEYCSSLTTVIFEENSQLESIGNNAFYKCSSLTSITLPSSVTSIGEWAFEDCSSLTNVYYSGTIEDWCRIIFDGWGSNPMTYALHFYMLDENNNYKEVTSIEIPSTITSIGDYQFYGFNNVTSITIPSSVTSIGSYAFYNCSSLTTVIFEENSQLESIGNNAFYYCSSLTSITLPSSVTTIGEWAFEDCSSLTTVIFEENSQLESIGNNAFYDCSSLTSITIPSSVTSIGSYAFYNCSSLTNVYYSGTIEDWCRIIFDGWGSNPMTYALHFYMLDENNNYKEVTSIEIPSTITSIGDYQFYGFNNVTSITIPSSVTTIGEWAFYNCVSLTIYCEASSKPSGWDSYWNYSDCPVVWEYIIE